MAPLHSLLHPSKANSSICPLDLAALDVSHVPHNLLHSLYMESPLDPMQGAQHIVIHIWCIHYLLALLTFALCRPHIDCIYCLHSAGKFTPLSLPVHAELSWQLALLLVHRITSGSNTGHSADC